jgi:hypothetical protein
MRFSQIICTAWNAAGEPKLAVVSVYSVTTVFTAMLENGEVWRWKINLDNSGIDNWLGAPSHPPLFSGKALPHLAIGIQ